MPRGALYVISAPSGTGKTTVVRRLQQLCPELAHAVSYTTRPPRAGDREGIDYFFVDHDTFQRMIDAGAFVEWAQVHGRLYGTPKAELERCLASGRDLMLDIDVQGAVLVKRFDPTATLIFLVSPSMAVLEQRLRQRGTDSNEAIVHRLRQAEHELRQQPAYDLVIVNDTVDDAVAQIIAAIRQRRGKDAAPS